MSRKAEQFGKQEKVGDRARETGAGNLVRGRTVQPVGLADENDPACAKAPGQKRDAAGHTSADPGGPDTRCHVNLLAGHISGRIAVNEAHAIGNAEVESPLLCLGAEERALVDAGPLDCMIARPGAQHLT